MPVQRSSGDASTAVQSDNYFRKNQPQAQRRYYRYEFIFIFRVKPLRVGPSYNSGGAIYSNKRVLAKSGGPLDNSSPINRKPKSAQKTSGLPPSNASYRKNQMYTVDVRNNADHMNLESQHINIAWNPENGKFTTFNNKKQNRIPPSMARNNNKMKNNKMMQQQKYQQKKHLQDQKLAGYLDMSQAGYRNIIDLQGKM